MANSKYEYVKGFEQSDVLLPQTWIVVRIDGRGFTRFAQAHDFEKPNDQQALHLMNECAKTVLDDLPDVVFGYGVSDEFSFVLRKTTTLYQRRSSKLVSVIVSLFAATYVMKWSQFFPQVALQYPPSFDGRAVCYPADSVLRDYLAWRQVDCHVNNQYNTCYWNLVKSGCNAAEAHAEIKGTLADFKNELLHSRFQINYNELPAMFRKGSLVFRRREDVVVKIGNGLPIARARSNVVVVHEDMIKDTFWNENPSILNPGALKDFKLRLKERDGMLAVRVLDSYCFIKNLLQRNFQVTNVSEITAAEARRGKDMQGILWSNLQFTIEKYRNQRLLHHKRFKNLNRAHEELDKQQHCKQLKKGEEVIPVSSESTLCEIDRYTLQGSTHESLCSGV